MRIVIPTIYRNNYLAALSCYSNGVGRGETVLAVVEFAQRWTAAVDWSSYGLANETLENCHAYVDPGVAENTNRVLRLP